MPIRLAENFRAVFYAPFYAAQALGLYRREGLDVDMINSSVPGDAVNSLLAGAIDITWGGPMRVMKARDRDPDSPLVCFCEVVGRDPFYLVGSGDPAAFRQRILARRPTVPPAAIDLLAAALAYDPEARPGDAEAFTRPAATDSSSRGRLRRARERRDTRQDRVRDQSARSQEDAEQRRSGRQGEARRGAGSADRESRALESHRVLHADEDVLPQLLEARRGSVLPRLRARAGG